MKIKSLSPIAEFLTAWSACFLHLTPGQQRVHQGQYQDEAQCSVTSKTHTGQE